MDPIQHKVGEVRAILAGRPLQAIHERERLRDARLSLGELQLALAEVPLNERPVPVQAVRDALVALQSPDGMPVAYAMLGGSTGITPAGQAPVAEVAEVAEHGMTYATFFRGVLIGVATVVVASLVLRAIPGLRRR